MARTKIRKTFKYPEENELDPVIDEQEQEQVIETLANQDASITAAYKVSLITKKSIPEKERRTNPQIRGACYAKTERIFSRNSTAK